MRVHVHARVTRECLTLGLCLCCTKVPLLYAQGAWHIILIMLPLSIMRPTFTCMGGLPGTSYQSRENKEKCARTHSYTRVHALSHACTDTFIRVIALAMAHTRTADFCRISSLTSHISFGIGQILYPLSKSGLLGLSLADDNH